MKLHYTYWQDGDWLVGFLDEYPGWMTQGKDIQELETMFLDLYDLCDDEQSLLSAKSTENNVLPPGVPMRGIIKIPVAVPA